MEQEQNEEDPVEDAGNPGEDVSLNTLPSIRVSILPFLREILKRLLSYFSTTERQILREVASPWRDVVDEVYGIKIRVQNNSSDLITSCTMAVDVDLNSMTIPFNPENISFANTIVSLTFSKILVSYNLITFLQACSGSLRQLKFANIILDQPISSLQNNEVLHLPKVETLELYCFTFTEGVLEIFAFLNERVSFESLKEVVIHVQNPPVLPYQVLFSRNFNPVTTHPLLQLVRKNRKSIRSFIVGRSSKPIIMTLHEPERVKFRNSEDNFGTDSYTGENPPQLEHFEIHPYFREEWTPILLNQMNIKILNLGSCNVSRWGEIQQAVAANSRTLQVFEIGGLSFGQVWDCSVFQGCIALKRLSIEISHSHKINLVEIPGQLTSLHVFGPVTKQEIVTVETLLELEELKFTHLGRIAEFNDVSDDRITLNTFKSLLFNLPKLKTLSFIACSSVSIDWDEIAEWCQQLMERSSRNPLESGGFHYSERFYQLHGENFRNGIDCVIADHQKFIRNAMIRISVEQFIDSTLLRV